MPVRQNPRVADSFTWRDGERLIRFGDGAAAEAPRLLAERGFDGYVLLSTERALAAVPALEADATSVVRVPPGRVDDISAALLDEVGERSLVALGGGRVVDTAKALAGARGQRCATLATTLSGAELTPFHRLPKGVEDARTVRPALVIADPALMASQPATKLASSAMNALAHALEALYTPLANPVCELAALRAATLIARGLEAGERSELALGALLAGYASGCTGVAIHHALCQTIVRTAGAPHAETNAVMLPHSAQLMTLRAPAELDAFAAALVAPQPAPVPGDPHPAAGLIARLAARCGHTRLGSLGVGEQHVTPIAAAAAEHPALQNTPDPPSAHEIADLVRAAL